MKKKIEDIINDVFTGDLQKNALDLISYLRANDLSIEDPGDHQWDVRYQDEIVCFIHFVVPEYLPKVTESERCLLIYSALEQGTWINWTDGEKNGDFVDSFVDERIKEIAWANLRICDEDCAAKCKSGRCKRVLGKEFNNVCISALMFVSPDGETLECVKRMIDARLSDIRKNIRT